MEQSQGDHSPPLRPGVAFCSVVEFHAVPGKDGPLDCAQGLRRRVQQGASRGSTALETHKGVQIRGKSPSFPIVER